MKLLEVDVADLLMPQLDVRLNLLPFREHNGVDIIRFEDKHPPIAMPLPDDFAFFFDEAHEMCESDLHPLVDNLSN